MGKILTANQPLYHVAYLQTGSPEATMSSVVMLSTSAAPSDGSGTPAGLDIWSQSLDSRGRPAQFSCGLMGIPEFGEERKEQKW
eukprot:g29422.t1